MLQDWFSSFPAARSVVPRVAAGRGVRTAWGNGATTAATYHVPQRARGPPARRVLPCSRLPGAPTPGGGGVGCVPAAVPGAGVCVCVGAGAGGVKSQKETPESNIIRWYKARARGPDAQHKQCHWALLQIPDVGMRRLFIHATAIVTCLPLGAKLRGNLVVFRSFVVCLLRTAIVTVIVTET